MKPVHQTKFTPDPNSPDCGNCFQAAIASILELPLDDVPNFVAAPEATWWALMQAWFVERGYWYLEFDVVEGGRIPWGYHIMHGLGSVSGGPHAVVGYFGDFVHDPRPGGGPLRVLERYGVLCALLTDNRPLAGEVSDV